MIREFTQCTSAPSRRSFLKSSGLSIGGLTLPFLLKSRGLHASTVGGKRDKAVILLWMAGGPSHIDTYDMKPDAASEVRGSFSPIATNLPGLQVCGSAVRCRLLFPLPLWRAVGSALVWLVATRIFLPRPGALDVQQFACKSFAST